jgi:hypothetical protein
MTWLMLSTALAGDVLIYADDNVTGAPIQADLAAARAGHSVSLYLDDPAGFYAALQTGGWDAVVIESVHNALPFDVEAAVRLAIFDGVPLLFSHWDLELEFATATDLGTPPVSFLTAPPALISPAAGDPYGLFAGLPGGLTPAPTDVLADNGDVLSLSRHGEFAALAGANPMTAMTHQGRVAVNGFMHVDYRNIDADGDGAPDVQELLANELDSLIWQAASQPRLVVTGACPGALPLTLDQLTPNGQVALLRSTTRGASTVPSGVCAGTEVDLSFGALRLLGLFRADAAGRVTLTPTVPALGCLYFVQAVDLATCEVTNVSGF